MNLQNNAGYSFGLKHSMESDLRALRRKQNLNIKRSIENVFDLENITKAKSPVSKRKQRSNSSKSIRELLIEKRENSKLMRVAKRERKLMLVKNKQENLSLEKQKKNEAFKAKFKLDVAGEFNRSLSRSKMRKSARYRVTGDNYSEGEFDDREEENDALVEESYVSEHGEEEDKRKRFLNERYNIEANRNRHLSKKRVEPDVTPGPGIFICLFIFLSIFFYLCFVFLDDLM